MLKAITFLMTAALFASTGPVFAQSNSMSSSMHMSMPEGPATFAPTRQAFTTNHELLVKLITLPSPIPYEKYFTIRFAVYDAAHPMVQIPSANIQLFAGMRHGLKHGFAHGMQSAPKIVDHGGVFTISGMYFHMMGPWTLKVTASGGGKNGVAYFQLPCCGS